MSDYKGARLVDNVINASPIIQRCIGWFPPRDVGSWLILMEPGRIIIIVVAMVASLEVIMRSGRKVLLRDCVTVAL
jgi:hypothetical protein